jgi:hypothetical protein
MKFQRWVARHLHWVPIAVSMCILAPAAWSGGALRAPRLPEAGFRIEYRPSEEAAAERSFGDDTAERTPRFDEVFQRVEQPNEPPAADLEQLRLEASLRRLGEMYRLRSGEGQAILRPGGMDPKPSPTPVAQRIDGLEAWFRERYKGLGQESEAVAIDNDVWFGSIREKGLNLILREAHTYGNGVINVRFADGVFDNIPHSAVH